jgi:signal transduction histidine kinase
MGQASRHTTSIPTHTALLQRATWRMGAQVSLCLAAIVVLLCGIAVFVVCCSQRVADNTLLTQTAAVADDVGDPPPNMWLMMRSSDGRWEITRGTPPGLPDMGAASEVTRTGRTLTRQYHFANGANYTTYTERRGNETIQTILDLAADHRERNRLVLAMLVSGGVGLVLAAGAGVVFGRRAMRPLAEALALQRRFVADASHELRTPLTLLSTRAQMLQRHFHQGGTEKVLTDEVEGVVGDARNLASILDDLLLTVDTRAQPPTSPVNLRELAEEVVAASIPSAAERSITIRTRGSIEDVLVRGTPTALRRTLTALLDNAVRHASTTVVVTVDRLGSEAILEVSDDGPGIDTAVLPHLFDRFSSTGSAHPEARRQYGLGLALVSEVAARLGGTVSARNAIDGGAMLRVMLPALPSGAQQRRRGLTV